MSDIARRIAENLAEVRQRIAEATTRSGRQVDAVTLVAVTKYVSLEVTQAVVAAGVLDLGESRPQELWSKAAALAETGVRWHMIGHLQRNKIRRTLPFLALAQSVDSLRLLEALEQEAAAQQLSLPVLLEVNVSGDSTKTGMAPDDVEPLLARAAEWPHLAIRGLMGMGSLEGGLAQARQDFAGLRRLRDRLAANSGPTVTLDALSMGMSNDYEVAIEEGATIVRVGSALFEGLES